MWSRCLPLKLYRLFLARQLNKCFGEQQIEWLCKAFQHKFSCVIKNCSRTKWSKSSQPIQQPYRLLNQRAVLLNKFYLKLECVFKDSWVAINFEANFCGMQNRKVGSCLRVGLIYHVCHNFIIALANVQNDENHLAKPNTENINFKSSSCSAFALVDSRAADDSFEKFTIMLARAGALVKVKAKQSQTLVFSK